MKKKTIKIIVGLGLFSLLVGAIIVYRMMNMPHRDVQSAKTDVAISAAALVHEYLADASMANNKYLEAEGDSKILAVSGVIASITEDQNNQIVILLKDNAEKAGVSCTFTTETNANTTDLKVGQTITVKGVIRSGAGFDEDLEMYEDVILEKCDIVKK
ncbi:hypothetical protein U1E44_11605 [Arenibacter sp. GZD96]|uniref:OB-fold protein n=1 Tax=Aurantibrevibacter litoralis TaxID=3106030 RepID=UPI002AFF79FD|nr:hypothetical protein [Arenibacter sp. GZD-96]MEA1786741.1 hypothetical protein [Arenibacter sp. GZD-96]